MARRNDQTSRPHPGRSSAGPFGPRGGLGGASDDFDSYLASGADARDAEGDVLQDPWAGWDQADLYGRDARLDRVDRGPDDPPSRQEHFEQDYVLEARDPDLDARGNRAYSPDPAGPDDWQQDAGRDRDFGGRDTAAWYARHGSNQQRMAALRQRQAQRVQAAGEDDQRAPAARERIELDHDYHLLAAERRPQAAYRPQAPHPGRLPGGRGHPTTPHGWAHGDPPERSMGWDEPSYGSSPTRQQEDHRGRGPRNVRRSDARIREDLCERLAEDPVVDATDVQVQCSDGVVVLEGAVATRRMKHRAEDVVDACPGVREIENRLQVRQRGVTRAEQRAP